jgi:hypothetical protein
MKQAINTNGHWTNLTIDILLLRIFTTDLLWANNFLNSIMKLIHFGILISLNLLDSLFCCYSLCYLIFLICKICVWFLHKGSLELLILLWILLMLMLISIRVLVWLNSSLIKHWKSHFIFSYFNWILLVINKFLFSISYMIRINKHLLWCWMMESL